MDVCKEMAIEQWVVGGEVVLQLDDGIDGPELGSAVIVFTILGALCVGYLEDCHVMAMMVGSRPNIGALDVHCRVEAAKNRDRKFACPDQGEEGGGEACSHCSIKQIGGVQFAEENLNQREGERFSFWTFRGGRG